MAAINFKEEFAPDVEFGSKRQTIRKVRKNPIVAGEELKLYTGQRTKKCRLLKVARCTRVIPIVIE